MATPLSERLEAIRSIVQQSTHDWLILITQMDPDALGSAFALKAIIEHFGATAAIRYCGSIGHPQNRAIINGLGLADQLKLLDPSDIKTGASIALVDSSSIRDSRLGGTEINPLIVIDHHRDSDLPDVQSNVMFWIDTVGAASTMLFELLEASAIKIDTMMATLLTLGIYTDTGSLVDACHRDREAYGRLTHDLRPEEVMRFIRYELSDSHFTNLQHALNHLDRDGARLIASLGQINPQDGDDVSTVADSLIRMEGVVLAITWAVIGTAVRVSARSKGLTLDLNEFLKLRFGPNSGAKMMPSGVGAGGAHLKLELGIWVSDGTTDDILRVVATRMKELVFSD